VWRHVERSSNLACALCRILVGVAVNVTFHAAGDDFCITVVTLREFNQA
jgi:hypothetical protein